MASRAATTILCISLIPCDIKGVSCQNLSSHDAGSLRRGQCRKESIQEVGASAARARVSGDTTERDEKEHAL